jgi:hypothetical protein
LALISSIAITGVFQHGPEIAMVPDRLQDADLVFRRIRGQRIGVVRATAAVSALRVNRR